MSENMMSNEHKTTNTKYRQGYDAIMWGTTSGDCADKKTEKEASDPGGVDDTTQDGV